ncbi:RNA polymerase II transcription factor SIII subunit A [Aspergillus steynii IBT 23096]|uniref:RNA polymerase II transcription factor SIII subunit A n=1 Tax=Aspergillus steynii IBT 23096 TaxID=1392250 RepID=A0A2I2G2H0_9EURO|nr:RNA polymerase II transcription factor SIII subunit A [Aspergillus steynii IBT 23096]PLB47078.1 RNA polymerase II transcription factor SIII subunit A [Aspergillus steynii IBT 23096]
MPAPSLRQLCTATAIRNVKYLSDIGNIPYALARPFLVRIESPERLRSIESQSPHIADKDGELWFDFIKRDIPKWDQYELPEPSECSYDLYCDLREQIQRALDEDARRLKMALDGISSERAKHNTKLVDRQIREKPTARQRYAQYDRKMGGIGPVFTGTSVSPFGRPPRLPEGKKKNNIFTATKRNNVLAVPTQHLNNRASQISQAPRSLIEEHRRPAEPPAAPRRKPPATPALRAPGRPRPHGTSSATLAVPPSLQEKEARLRAIASGQRSTLHASTPASSRAETEVSSTGSRSSQQNTPRPPPSRGTRPVPGNTHSPARTGVSSPPNGAGAVPSQSKASPEQTPRPAMVRKRPPPSVFHQPKRRKL